MRAGSWIRGSRVVGAALAAVWLSGLPVRALVMPAPKPVKIDLANDTERERKTRAQLERVLASYDLTKYTFTRRVTIEERAINHAFPVLTLNARFADSPDELLSSYLHEQLHWHLRDHSSQQQDAVGELRRMYPSAPVGLPEGAENAFRNAASVDCYLEIQADRQLIGRERTTTPSSATKTTTPGSTRPSSRTNPDRRAQISHHHLDVR